MYQLINLDENQVTIKNEDEIVGLFILRDNESIQSNIKFIHKDSDIYSRINLKFILLDTSQLDLQATVIIEQGASRTNTYLKIDTLLLSENARANVVPSMEIMEDNVKGGHGATIGMLDEKQIWYLMSRGLSRAESETFLIEAFVTSMLEKIEDPKIKLDFQNQIAKLINHSS